MNPQHSELQLRCSPLHLRRAHFQHQRSHPLRTLEHHQLYLHQSGLGFGRIAVLCIGQINKFLVSEIHSYVRS